MNDNRSSEIVSNSEGRQYHINLAPGELAEYVILCGDPARSHRAGQLLNSVKIKRANREFVTYTGNWKELTVSVLSTGIGTDNIEIAVVEAIQLYSTKKPTFIRVGSSGGLRSEVALGDLVISSGAVRLENTSTFFVDDGYPAVANHEVILALLMAADSMGFRYHVGLTASASGFYGAQGRDTPNFQPKDPKLPEKLANQNVLNFEMESSTLFTLGSLADIRAGTVCAVYANRSRCTFIKETDKLIAEENCLITGLEALRILAKMDNENTNSKKPYFIPTFAVSD